MGGVLDNTAKILGTVMLVLIGYVAFSTNPPVAEAATHAVAPTHYPWLATITPYRWYRRWFTLHSLAVTASLMRVLLVKNI